MDRVIVLLEPMFYRHQEDDRFAARFPKLGLTSFGETREDALESLKALFVTFVKVRREKGTLEKFLDAADVEWYPESKYPPGKGTVEYLVGPDANQKSPQQPKKPVESNWTASEALAA